MKRISTLDVRIDDSLKVKGCTLVITSWEASSNSREKIKRDGQASSHPISLSKVDDLEAKTRLAEAPETSKNAKDFQHGQANRKFLKCYFL